MADKGEINRSKNRKKVSGKRILMFLGLFVFLAGISALFVYIDPAEIIDVIGIQNGYLITAFLALLGGFSSVTSVSFYASIVTFTVGGLHPFWLTLVSIPGLLLGDTVYYFFGHLMNEVAAPRIMKFIDKLTAFIYRPKIHRFSPIFIFIYVGLTPLPPEVSCYSSFCRKISISQIIPAINAW